MPFDESLFCLLPTFRSASIIPPLALLITPYYYFIITSVAVRRTCSNLPGFGTWYDSCWHASHPCVTWYCSQLYIVVYLVCVTRYFSGISSGVNSPLLASSRRLLPGAMERLQHNILDGGNLLHRPPYGFFSYNTPEYYLLATPPAASRSTVFSYQETKTPAFQVCLVLASTSTGIIALMYQLLYLYCFLFGA